MLLPPPETATVATSQNPEALVAIVTLIAIGVTVYVLGKITLPSLNWLLRTISFLKRAGQDQNNFLRP